MLLWIVVCVLGLDSMKVLPVKVEGDRVYGTHLHIILVKSKEMQQEMLLWTNTIDFRYTHTHNIRFLFKCMGLNVCTHIQSLKFQCFYIRNHEKIIFF